MLVDSSQVAALTYKACSVCPCLGQYKFLWLSASLPSEMGVLALSRWVVLRVLLGRPSLMGSRAKAVCVQSDSACGERSGTLSLVTSAVRTCPCVHCGVLTSSETLAMRRLYRVVFARAQQGTGCKAII